jgi:hypothetical protein
MVEDKLQRKTDTRQNPVANAVPALTAVVRPILEGTLFTLQGDLVAKVARHDKVTVDLPARLYPRGAGQCGGWAA